MSKSQIILTVHDQKGKNILFVLDTFKALNTTYIRSAPNLKKEDNLDFLSVAIHRQTILAAARFFKIDSYLLGAILIDEFSRIDILAAFDWWAKLGQDTSIGVAQVKISTAKELIEREFYNPNPKDARFSSKNIDKLSAKYLHAYLDDPKHSIYFAGAKIRQVIRDNSSKYDLRNLEYIADLYSRKDIAKTGVSSRGKQIAKEFYKMAQRILNP